MWVPGTCGVQAWLSTQRQRSLVVPASKAAGSVGGAVWQVCSTQLTPLQCAPCLPARCLAAVAPPAQRYMRYHEEWLKRCLLRIFSAPPRSVERQHFRLAALRECHACMWRAGCSALPYEAAVWLLEEEEEIKGGHVAVGGQASGTHAPGRPACCPHV
jgi:hypothetical protein